MPRRAARPCRWIGCPGLTTTSDGYCAEHRKLAQRQRSAGRPSAAAQGYGVEWRKLRKRYLDEHPYCVQCGRWASVVHHVVRKRAGGTDDDSNLRAMCPRCHNAETMRHDVRRDAGSRRLVR